MNKILKLSAVSMLAVMTANGAHAAGYTCNDLVEYTSCNTGYYLNGGDCLEGSACAAGKYLKSSCPDGYYSSSEYDVDPENGWCYSEEGICQQEYWCITDKDDCENDGSVWHGPGCSAWEYLDNNVNDPNLFIPFSYTCTPCAAGTYQNAAGQYACNECVAGTYQPNKGQASCIDAPVGNYVAGTGETEYTPCSTGSYQPTAGQESCITCPAGSYCAEEGLSAVSGQCNKGTYSVGGATECLSCPVSDLTDAGGNVVSVTTESTGSTSINACLVTKGTEFKDDKGTYHYKSDCEFRLWRLPEMTEELCNEINATETTEGIEWTWNGDGDCYAEGGQSGKSSSILDGITEEECNDGDGVWYRNRSEGEAEWKDNKCTCSEGDLGIETQWEWIDEMEDIKVPVGVRLVCW